MPVLAYKHQPHSRAWIGLGSVQEDLREYFYRDKVGIVARRQCLMDYVKRQQLMAFTMVQQLMTVEESARVEGGYAIEVRAIGVRVQIVRVEFRHTGVRIHGEWWLWVLIGLRDLTGLFGGGKSQRMPGYASVQP
jgi:hypothetical protein